MGRRALRGEKMGVAIWDSRRGRTQGGQVKVEWDGVCVHTYQQGLAISGQVYDNIAEKAGCQVEETV